MTIFKKVVGGVVLAIALFLEQSKAAEEPAINIPDLIKDTQKQGTKAGRVTLVWWAPQEFFRASMRAQGTVTAEQIEEVMKAMDGVMVFAVLDGKIGALGEIEYTPIEEVKKNIVLLNAEAKNVPMLPEAKQKDSLKNLLNMIKPLFGTMMGKLGQNISFLVFEGKDKAGNRWPDPAKPGGFTVKLNNEEFRWRLPLGSLLPARKCSKCNESSPGNFAFCPFDATPLK